MCILRHVQIKEATQGMKTHSFPTFLKIFNSQRRNMQNLEMRSSGDQGGFTIQKTSVAKPRTGRKKQKSGKQQKESIFPPPIIDEDPRPTNNHEKVVFIKEGEGIQREHKIQERFDFLPPLVSQVVELWKRRQAWHREEKSLTLQIKGFCRRLCPLSPGKDKIEVTESGKKIFAKNPEADRLYKAIMGSGEHELFNVALLSAMPLMAARDIIETSRLEVEKEYLKLAKKLPGYKFCTETDGVTPAFLIAIVGEAPGVNHQSLLDFDTQHRLWKRLGLSCMPDGTRQRAVAGAEAMQHGYNPKRRSVVWTFGSSIVRGQNGPYYEMYVKFREQELQKWNEKNITVISAGDIVRIQKKETLEERQELYVSIATKDESVNRNFVVNAETEYRNKLHFNNHVKRLMEKELVKDLWQAFRKEAAEMGEIHVAS